MIQKNTSKILLLLFECEVGYGLKSERFSKSPHEHEVRTGEANLSIFQSFNLLIFQSQKKIPDYESSRGSLFFNC